MQETYGSSSRKRQYVRGASGKLKVHEKHGSDHLSVSHVFRSVFLPQGYPESVSEDYMTYQIWDTIQAFASSITGTLAAQAVLKGVGVGDVSATVLAATMTWLLKDGTGMLGRILFAWAKGTHLDCDAKRWRLFADIINDIAIFLEILGPHFPSVFTFILCTAGVLKSIVGVSGGATRAALTQHQARRNNMADVSAKDGSQETLVNLLALLCNLALVPLVTGKHLLIWMLYFVFTGLHLYANYSAVRGVVMETINQARLHILLQEYFKSGTILSPTVVNSREPVLWNTRRKFDIKLGVSISDLCDSSYDVEDIFDIYQNSNYLLWINYKEGEINVALKHSASVSDQLQACYHAELLNFILTPGPYTQMLSKEIATLTLAVLEKNLGSVSASYSYCQKTVARFLEDLRRHSWNTDIGLLCADEWRIQEDGDHPVKPKLL